MNYISKNYGVLLDLMFKTLDRKPVSNTEARENYKDILFEYCQFLHKLSQIELSNKLNNKLNQQYNFLLKIDSLTQRYKSIGDEAISDDNVEAFLKNVQNNMREWINYDLDKDLRIEETKWFNQTAYEKRPQTDSFTERRKSEAVDVLMESARKRVDF